MKGKQSLLQSKGLNASVYEDYWSRLINLVIMCVVWDQQLKAGRQTQPGSLGLGFVYAPEAAGRWINRSEGKGQGQNH